MMSVPVVRKSSARSSVNAHAFACSCTCVAVLYHLVLYYLVLALENRPKDDRRPEEAEEVEEPRCT